MKLAEDRIRINRDETASRPMRDFGGGQYGRICVTIRRAIRHTLKAESVPFDCELSVLLTDDEGIARINHEQRDLDKPTDVLSFPQYELVPGHLDAAGFTLSPETGKLFLGDIVLSLQRARAQAREYGHSPYRELSYLTVHSVLHLLGYDHMDEAEDKALMRSREKEIMAGLKVRWL